MFITENIVLIVYIDENMLFIKKLKPYLITVKSIHTLTATY